jgi:hypothetical protein
MRKVCKNVIHETIKHFRNKKMQYLTVKIMGLKTKKKKNNKCLFRSVNRMKKDYQSSNNSVRDRKGDLHADPYSTFHRQKNHFCLPEHTMGKVTG